MCEKMQTKTSASGFCTPFRSGTHQLPHKTKVPGVLLEHSAHIDRFLEILLTILYEINLSLNVIKTILMCILRLMMLERQSFVI